MDPSVIKKIEDKRREKTRPDGDFVPAHRDLPDPHHRQKAPETKDKPEKTPPSIIEIRVT
jgi:hypothetical protein